MKRKEEKQLMYVIIFSISCICSAGIGLISNDLNVVKVLGIIFIGGGIFTILYLILKLYEALTRNQLVLAEHQEKKLKEAMKIILKVEKGVIELQTSSTNLLLETILKEQKEKTE
ncbi:MAG: hypothetical protein LBO09_01945 [Candidatus Peribacteria bacterium]|jgi:arginine exporter protein ArgO|nr:hypothetical protein [Candidatus Peribacteria bacterium]